MSSDEFDEPDDDARHALSKCNHFIAISTHHVSVLLRAVQREAVAEGRLAGRLLRRLCPVKKRCPVAVVSYEDANVRQAASEFVSAL